MEFVVLTHYCYFLHLPFKFHFLHHHLLASLSLSLLALPLLENMENSKAEGKRSMKDRGKEEEDVKEDNKKKRALTHSDKKGSGGGSTQPCCQVEDCTANMSNAKSYHRRHKVCEFHAKAPVVLVAGIQQRFCQQCSRFHELPEFDDTKRSCRKHLLGHNERRRKSSYDLPGEGSSRIHISCQQINERISNDLP